MNTTADKHDFSFVLFKRTNAYLSESKRMLFGQVMVYAKAMAILMFYGWAYYRFLMITDSLSSMLVSSILLGIGHVLIPTNITHDAIHGAFSNKKWINSLALYSMNLVGANPYMYQKKHLQAHDDKESGSRRKSIETQQLLLKKSDERNLPVVLYLFYAIYMIFIRDFGLFYASKKDIPWSKWISMVIHKVLYFVAIWVIPFIVIPLPGWKIFIGIFSIYLVITVLLIIILLMPTTQIDVSKEGFGDSVSDAWVQEVLKHNVDFSPQSRLLNFLSGGSNMNVIHYLFPRVNHIHYVGMAKILRETADEFDVEYRHQNILKVFGIHFRYMKELNRP